MVRTLAAVLGAVAGFALVRHAQTRKAPEWRPVSFYQDWRS